MCITSFLYMPLFMGTQVVSMPLAIVNNAVIITEVHISFLVSAFLLSAKYWGAENKLVCMLCTFWI